ncbi:cytochrome c [Geotalea uraniireducens]|uniref:Cytochrome c n=1 Tax=Geotalea uraniireducens TaxID=351604 RepID=A0ABM8EJ80_9BACT|nr:cytochrome C [Geotalea uraniireducens]BDV42060.1 cytochrome c [Geotalea uraniireducens]
MRRVKLFFFLVAVLGLATVTACTKVISSESSLPSWHPEALPEGRADCTECHEDTVKGVLKPYASFSHSTVFIKNHRYYAGQDNRLCAVCHKPSFCNDCHANELEVKPSVMHGDRPDREMIHRGDYLSRHQIDGKIDPTSCFRCHGRTNNEQCVACHR